jgi:hypothetical protein
MTATMFNTIIVTVYMSKDLVFALKSHSLFKKTRNYEVTISCNDHVLDNTVLEITGTT